MTSPSWIHPMCLHQWQCYPVGHFVQCDQQIPVEVTFETSVFLWLSHHSAIEEHPSGVATEEGSLEFRILSCKEGMEFFHSPSDLKDVDKHDLCEHPMCLVPNVQTFPTFNTIILTNEFIITAQMTIINSVDQGPYKCIDQIHLQVSYNNLDCLRFAPIILPRGAQQGQQWSANNTRYSVGKHMF